MPAPYVALASISEQVASPDGRFLESSAMDRIDNAILDHLEGGGRLTNAELAERVRLSPSACLRRVRALEAAGVIAGYHAVIDPAARDRGFQVLVYTTLMLRNRETIEAFEAAISPLDEVIECQRMFGDPDYLIRVAVADAEAYEHFLINTFADLPGLDVEAAEVGDD